MAGPLSRRLPRAYFSAAFPALILACALLAVQAGRVATSPLHHDTLAVVHLVTLGWLTCTILGATYLVLPMILQASLPAGRGDGIACALVLIAVSGVVSHFWLDGYSGVAWSGVLLAPVLAWIAARVWRSLSRCRAPAVLRAHVACAYGNAVLAVGLGALVAFDHDHAFVRAGHQAVLHAHAHLAGAGFVGVLFTGLAYRMLPMLLPAAPPRGPGPWLSLAALQIGTLGLTLAFVTFPPSGLPFACLLAIGMVVFFVEVGRMFGRRKPAPKDRPRPDPATLLAVAGVAHLAIAVGLGLLVLFEVVLAPRWRSAYAASALLAGFGQAALGVSMRLLPWHAWMLAWRGDAPNALPPPPHAMGHRRLQWLAAGCWLPAAPALVAGLALGAPMVVRGAAAVLGLGAAAAALNALQIARDSRRGSQPDPA